MSISSKLSVLSLALGVAFSSSAFATGDVWDSASDPWGTATLSQFAGWNVFNSTNDTTPEVAGSGAGSVKENTGTAFLTGGGNIYSFSAPTDFTATLAGTGTGFFDVYLRVATLGTVALNAASLDGVSATKVITFSGGSGNPNGGSEEEAYWKWTNVSAKSLYTFNFGAVESSMSLDQVTLATVAITTAPVPEPTTYSMMAAGLALMGFIARRRKLG